MAYADQKMSGNRLTALIVVAILHVIVGYALVTGLAYEAVQKIKERVETFDVKEEKPPEEPPPPPPPDEAIPPPPIVAPPPPITFNQPAPQVQTVVEPPKVVLPPTVVAPPPPPPPPPAAPRTPPKGAVPKGNPGSWATPDDYPSRALREEREGTTRFRVSVGPDGRVTDCQITGSSGSPDLDEAACKNITRRARFNPATDGNGQPTTGSYANSVRWVIPKG